MEEAENHGPAEEQPVLRKPILQENIAKSPTADTFDELELNRMVEGAKKALSSTWSDLPNMGDPAIQTCLLSMLGDNIRQLLTKGLPNDTQGKYIVYTLIYNNLHLFITRQSSQNKAFGSLRRHSPQTQART